ncbi:hypothetical protein FRC01_005659 [Tulasnella sp. 417]|nr:hypothetical protein FRC01_005659 [Tulasnella sp. 417]
MERVIPHIQRWGAVNLSDMALQHIPQTPAPRLHELVLTSRHDIWGPDIPQQIFGGDCSSLRRLVLEYVAFAGTHEHFPVFGKNLRSLIIRQLGQRHSEITYTHVYQFLLQHPNLVELEIQTFKWSNATANPELLAELHLPSLRRFKLFGLVSHGQAHALPIQKIKAPNCTSFELRIPMGTQEPSGVLWAIAPYFVSVITAVPKDLKFSLAFDPDFTIAIGRGEKKFKVTLSGNCRDAGLDWVMNMLAQHRPNVTCFSISGLWTRLDEELSNLFAVLTDVTQFHVGGSMLAVWNTLGRPREPAADGGPVQWLLPDLEQLVVRNPSGEGELHQCFIAAMQAREAAAVERHATGRQSRDHPKVLTKVEYQSGSQPKQDKQLSDILGDRLFD